MQDEAEQILPLDGLTVIEVSTSVAAPFGAMILADLGAEVIKVENPKGGDTSREWGKPIAPHKTAVFDAYNRNKKSVTLDLWSPDGLRQFRDLIARADVLLQNLRPGSFEKLGLSPDALLALNPRLVYCALSGYGREGPLSDRPGYDPLIQGFTGMTELTGDPDRRGVRVGVPMIDLGTGMWSSIGILAALRRRDATGKGGVVETALYDTGMGWMSLAFAELLNYGRAPKRAGTAGPPGVAPNRAFPTADGDLALMAGHNAHFRKLCEAIGRPEWVEDERFGSSRDRSRHDEELAEMIGEVLKTQPRAFWMEKLTQAGVPHAPVHTPEEVIAHPHTEAAGILHEGRDGSSAQIALPLKLDGERLPYRRRAPDLGEHNGEVLREEPTLQAVK